jgi:drug/metabolite transporter (DMT)-like permease
MLLLSAVFPWGLGTLLQLTAQRSVSPTRTQLLLTVGPVFTVILASSGILGPSERYLAPAGWAGVAIIVIANIVGSIPSRDM